MPSLRPRHLFLALLAAVALPLQAATIIVNANGYTLTAADKLQQFSALGIDDAGRVVVAGSRAEVQARLPQAKVVDAGGRTLLPGLIDAHGHVFGLGHSLGSADLRAARTLADAQKLLADYQRSRPGKGWLNGWGWNQAIWKLGRFPTAAELDAVTGERPAYLRRIDGHAAWVNSAALAAAGISKKTPDPQGGRIERLPDGSPSGILVDGAMALVEKIIPPPTEAEMRQALDAALAQIAAAGLTSVHDAGVGEGEDRLYREYADAGKLTVRVYGMIGGVEGFFDKAAASGPLNSYANDMYALRAVKLFSDGALGSRGAAMLAPYSDADTRGLLFNADAAMFAQMRKAMLRGYQVNVHAIGDAGNRQILDGFQKLAATPALRAQRHRVEHAQVVALGDIPRFKTLGILPSMQPVHATSDMNMAEDRVGPHRIAGAYAWRSFLQQGSRIACGSDFPVEAPFPFWGIHAAVMREDADGQPLGGWHAEQAMSLKEALRCFTLDAAYAGHQEKQLGSLEPGKWADFILVDQDIFRMSPRDLHKVQVLQTWVAGRKVYGK